MLLRLEVTNKIPKELSEFIRSDATKSNAYGNEPHTITNVEAAVYLKQRFINITICLNGAKKRRDSLVVPDHRKV